MSYQKKDSTDIFEAEQLKVDTVVNNGGDIHAPAGYWVVSLNGVTVECPSDESFKENYSTSNKPQKKNVVSNKESES